MLPELGLRWPSIHTLACHDMRLRMISKHRSHLYLRQDMLAPSTGYNQECFFLPTMRS